MQVIRGQFLVSHPVLRPVCVFKFQSGSRLIFAAGPGQRKMQMIGQTLSKTAPRQMDLDIAASADVPTSQADASPMDVVVVLARALDAKGVMRADLLRDLVGLIAAPEAQLVALAAAGQLYDSAGQVSLTAAGRNQLMTALGVKASPKEAPKTWGDARLIFTAQALGLKLDAVRKKALAKPDGLRAAILDQAFDLKLKGAMTNARLRSALAVVALERAFGNKVKAGLGTGSGLNPKAGRVLAGQLSKAPRDFGTDSRLVAALSAEQVGATSHEFEALRTALIGRLIGASVAPVAPKPTKSKSLPVAVPTPAANDPSPTLTPVPHASAAVLTTITPALTPRTPPITPDGLVSRPAASNRPDLAGFAVAIKASAKLRAEGWSGSRKSYIADVWEDVKSRFTSWGLTEVEFKSMLAEAHRTGHIVLANADLKTKDNAARLAASAIVYKNTVWHYVRVED
jgi:hypothetical protein